MMGSDMKLFLALFAVAIVVLYRKRIWDDIVLLRREPKHWLWIKWKEWGEPFVIAIILAVLIRTFIIGPYKIPTGSMRTTLIEGDRIFVDKISYRFHEAERGDVIVFKYPLDRKKDFVKRLIAFEDEVLKIRDGIVFIDGDPVDDVESISKNYYYNRSDWKFGKEGMEIEVPPENYFVLGDNSAHSSDSRNWGFVKKKDVIGRAVVKWWPPKRIGFIE